MNNYTRKKARELRAHGRTYAEIQKILRLPIPKSTLSNWCADVPLSKMLQNKITNLVKQGGHRGRAVAVVMNQEKRNLYIQGIQEKNKPLTSLIKEKEVAKIALAMLYLGEGSKQGGSLMFGNSNEIVIGLYLKFLRQSFRIDEKKFRCTVQCRADQNVYILEKYWSKITNIPLCQFYKAQIDPRTVGKPSRKLDYKGVCRIDYFSAEYFEELKAIAQILYKGL